MHNTRILLSLLAVFTMSAACVSTDGAHVENDPEQSDDGGTDGDDAGAVCRKDSQCSDGRFCNGVERCDPDSAYADELGCVRGKIACPDRACDETNRECVACSEEADIDGDGHESTSCGGNDCNDNDPTTFPGNVEVCDPDNHDEDCDPDTFGDLDADGDRAVSDQCCNVNEDGDLRCGTDCDDTDLARHPKQPEFCDNKDNDCDGEIDNDPGPVPWYADEDEDLYGAGEMLSLSCSPIPGASVLKSDCDDSESSRHPGQLDICDGIDNDCDGSTDEDCREADWDGDGQLDDDDDDDDNDFVKDEDDGCPRGKVDWIPDPVNDADNDGCHDEDEDDDDDNDGVRDRDDDYPTDPLLCGDRDQDTSDDCAAGGEPDVGNDGPDYDGDGRCDDGDDDDDNDRVNDVDDDCPMGELGWTSDAESDPDGDGCDDRNTPVPAGDDRDGDGVADDEDIAPDDPTVCRDVDADGCDDCSQRGADGSGGDVADDGADLDDDGLCDAGDPDLDDDGVANTDDRDPSDASRCRDVDADGCDDCTVTASDGSGGDPANDGPDANMDGICDVGESDIDADGVANDEDSHPSDASRCRDADADGCDDCATTRADGSGGDPANDGADRDADGTCDVGDDDQDGDGVVNGADACPLGEIGWTSGPSTDADADGCRDATEDVCPGDAANDCAPAEGTIFSEDFEDDPRWFADNGQWAVGESNNAPSATHVAATNPNGNYTGTDSRFISQNIELPQIAGDQMLELRFMNWFRFSGATKGYVQVQERPAQDDSDWITVGSGVGGDGATWTETARDLSDYAGKTVRIGFLFDYVDGSANTGWYIDDVTIAVRASTIVVDGVTGYHESFEDDTHRWWAEQGLWDVAVRTGATDGTRIAGTNTGGNYTGTDSRFISPALELPSVSSEQVLELTFDQWFRLSAATNGSVQVQERTGPGQWGAWATIGGNVTGDGATWTETLRDLSAYAGKTVRIAFLFDYVDGSANTGWSIDDVTIAVRASTIVVDGVTGYHESFEDDTHRWWAERGLWDVAVRTGATDGTRIAGTNTGGNYTGTDSRFISPVLELPTIASGQALALWFDQWFRLSGNTVGRVEVQQLDSQGVWGDWEPVGADISGDGATWTAARRDLSSYAGSAVRIGFLFDYVDGSANTGWSIDNVEILTE